ncbi:MAG: aldo/keto reductase [Proteobacteria bacterium]|nr:aldo/keto reductase [Pseudomonadota bacterium]
MIEKRAFGATGFESSRVLFGAAALAAMKPARVEQTLALIEREGVNHIDTAAGYGDSELNLAGWLSLNRASIFLATKTAERIGTGARESLENSLTRMGVDHVDLIQLHNLVDREGWEIAMAPGGAVEALVQARDEGLVRFIGVTGHGTWAPAMHQKSLDEFEFASVLCPLNFSMMAQPEYAADFEKLAVTCRERNVALQTIKALARRRWQAESGPRFSWYEPLSDADAIRRGVHWVLSRDDVFLNSSSDGRLLETTLEAAKDMISMPSEDAMREDTESFVIEPLFVRGASDTI